MLNLMIVDDESVAVNLLSNALEEWGKYELTINKAYSGIEALDRIQERRLDILLTDIRMPGMNGLELADHVLDLWPRCKIIFLSGYNDFEYIQKAIRKGGMDYILKAEDDELIFQAIEKAAEEIKTELHEGSILKKAQELMQQAIPTMRRDYFMEMLGGEMGSEAARVKRFAELDIHLDPMHDVYLVVGRVDDWGTNLSTSDRTLLSYSIQNIAEEFLADKFRFLFLLYDRFRFVWFIQPKQFALPQGEEAEVAWERVRQFVKGTSESIQATCSQLLKLPISLMLSSKPSSWEKAAGQFDSLKLNLSSGLIRSEEKLVVEPSSDAAGLERSSKTFFAEMAVRNHMRKLDLLEAHLDSGDKVQFVQHFHEFTRLSNMELSETKLTYLTMEMFANLSSFFLSYMSRRNLIDELGAPMKLDKYVQFDNHSSWEAALAYFRQLGEMGADFNGRLQQERTHEMIRILHQYVHDYMREDLTLTRLAEVVYLSPPYLSRLYKQLTGNNLTDYVTEQRMVRAKKLLKNTTMKIHEIAYEVGFESAPYFTRVFKKLTGSTPIEYRESN
ncbi:response regulator [Paenibacillus sp. LMG 31461]|uniref:Response regulator n=1 Tax=Paenibacillus plantarum TaxID=2654975 RepID=A0ABX1X2I7_9BACL|nr:response regulator [Paenibacillus plantarum]NOU62623.1 response regulator [Paenibacillus plantarum]